MLIWAGGLIRRCTVSLPFALASLYGRLAAYSEMQRLIALRCLPARESFSFADARPADAIGHATKRPTPESSMLLPYSLFDRVYGVNSCLQPAIPSCLRCCIILKTFR